MNIDQKQYVLSEIKTNLRILNTWGNVLVPNLDGKETYALDRLTHFVDKARADFGMTVEEIEIAIEAE